MNEQEHWESVYRSKPADGVSWYQPHAVRSLAFIRATGIPGDARIIDVGGGASTLVDDLLEAGFRHVSVLDISARALAVAEARLGAEAAQVHWIEGDIRTVDLPAGAFDVWHDRAVFHFLTDPGDRAAYARQMRRAMKPGGHVVMATFGPDGPEKCSGLPVQRYAPDTLLGELGPGFELVASASEDHETPWGTVQQFIYCHCVMSR